MKTCKKLLSLLVLCGISIEGFCASSLKKEDNSTMTIPSVPSMPSVVMPGFGTGFYRPGAKGFYSGTNPYVPKKQTAANDAGEKDNKAQKTDEEKSAVNPLVQALTGTSAGLAGINGTQLTASDLSSLDSMGLLGSMNGLLSGKTLSATAANNSVILNQNLQDSKKLESILSELTDLKAKVLEKEKNEALINITGFATEKKIEPKILRFNVNGRDILSTCRQVFFSEQESDGTFLLTGDRKFITDNQNRDETFYFYFHSKGSDGGITKYTVTPAISQDSENKKSSLFELTQKNELEAQRTGNLVTLRASQGNWKMDILLSLDK